MTRRMIFYLPRPLDRDVAAASQIRPRAMLQAFRDIGYDVTEVVGDIAARLPRMRAARRALGAGTRYEFLYMESATLPLHMLEPRLKLLTRHPFADASFLAELRRHGIPVGVFYRDAHWRFAVYRDTVPPLRRWLRTALHHAELAIFSRHADVFYVPHSGMLAHLPARFRRTADLPPGVKPMPAGFVARPATIDPSEPVRLLYVGGIGPQKRLSALLAAVARVPGVELILNCPEADWRQNQSDYAPVMSDRVRVAHAANEALEPLYAQAHVLSCLLEPTPYRDFVMPVKLFEYLGQGRPLLATAGSAAGQFVSANDVGWAVPYQTDELVEFLRTLRQRPDFAAKARKATMLAPAHTWRARAESVARDLGGAVGADPAASGPREPAGAGTPPDQGARMTAAVESLAP